MSIDTICALATAPGGALGIIRISGAQALEILSHVFSKNLTNAQPNTIHYGHIVDFDAASQHQEVVDEVMVSVFKAPKSYTGEDSVEISCHGSSYILNKVLELLIQHGCRMANPGEYTQRAYLNGKMDLSQAEAVADLIASTNKATHQMAMSQLRGGISTELSSLRDKLLKLTSLLELELDFSDHEDLEFADRTELLELALQTNRHITRLADSFDAGNALKNGIPVAIVGAPNVGKSTLLNALLGEERAIVSDVQGTTRDTIEDTIQLGGKTFRFIDTAGIRQTDNQIELMGIERTYQMIERARIVIWLIDTLPTEQQQRDFSERCKEKSLIIVCNKFDKGVAVENASFLIPHASFVNISAKFGMGLDTLCQQLLDAAPKMSDGDTIVTNARHYEALTRAQKHLQRVIDGLQQQLSGDLLAEDLRLVLDTLAEITGGYITPQETLNTIFSHFCVGK